MIETYGYFEFEVDVERAGTGGVSWFMTFYRDEGERFPFHGIALQENGSLVYQDGQTTERFVPQSNRTREYVRGKEAGTTRYQSQTAWATHKYHNFLRYLARARVSNTLHEQIRCTQERMADEAFVQLKTRVLDFGPSLKQLRQETRERFDVRSNDSYVFIWHFIQALQGSPQARSLVKASYPRVRERWNWAKFDCFFERALA